MRLPIICPHQAWCWLLVWDDILTLRTHHFILISAIIRSFKRHLILSIFYFFLTFYLEMYKWSVWHKDAKNEREVPYILNPVYPMVTFYITSCQNQEIDTVQCIDLIRISVVLQVLMCTCILWHFITPLCPCIYYRSKNTAQFTTTRIPHVAALTSPPSPPPNPWHTTDLFFTSVIWSCYIN